MHRVFDRFPDFARLVEFVAGDRVSRLCYFSTGCNVLFKYCQGKCLFAVFFFQKRCIFKRDFYMDTFEEAVSEGKDVLLLTGELV